MDEFSFVLLSDRTAMARPGVFERAVHVTNLLRPDFAIQVGDTIEGYTHDPIELARQWGELDAITATLQVPLFRVPGNHDVSNSLMRAEWLRRHGSLHYDFRYHDVLFVVLDTQDPPGDPDQELVPVTDRRFGSATSWTDWEGTMPAALSEQQVAWAEDVIARNADVRWTILCLHMPAWQGAGHPGFERIRSALAARPYTAFCGHVHNYKRTVIDGRDHIRLGPTGGTWVLPGAEGNFDHIAWVTMTHSGPLVANIVLEGVLGVDGGAFQPTPPPPAEARLVSVRL